MPEPTHPPYSQGAQAIPRMLNRWLDINAQNGPLTRTLSYITLPAFSVAVDWKGYSELVAAFNYEGPNNFTLKSVPVVTNPNYVLCIMWEDDERVTHRYALWRGVGEVFYFSAPVYNLKQPGLIKRNFRFEVWSTNNTPATQSSELVFYTSVRGDLDYRFGDDFTLVGTDGLVSDFALASTVANDKSTAFDVSCGEWVGTKHFMADLSTWDGSRYARYVCTDTTQYYIDLTGGGCTLLSVSGGVTTLLYYASNGTIDDPISAIWAAYSGVLPVPVLSNTQFSVEVFPVPLTFPSDSVPATN